MRHEFLAVRCIDGPALVAAAIGWFSVVAYLVERRRMRSACDWHLIGGVAAFALGGLAQPLLFETDARDPGLAVSVALALLGAALLAGGVPALRARRVDPMLALRDE